MGYTIRAEVKGVKELVKTLNGLEKKLKKKLLRAAVSAGGKVVLKKARQGAPKETGLLKKSLGQKVKVYRDSGTATAIVGPRSGPKFRQQVTRTKGRRLPRVEVASPTKYAHLVELGTPHSAARPFLSPAAGARAAIRDAMTAAIEKGLAKAGVP